MWRNTTRRWGLVAILLHWLSAAVIIGLFALGWWMTGLSYFDSWYNLGPWWHRSLGVLLLLATLLRVGWRIVQPTPQAQGHRFERMAAHVGHILLYVLLLVVLISGYMISTANGRGISVFGWFEAPAILYGLPNQASVAGNVHWYSALALMILAAGHALAAFKHHFIDRHDTLVRMLRPRVGQTKFPAE
ncbi:Cytochrome b561 [Franzmannia pantelleriensis]|uniref:Cytochrome b561 n=1 Tax=Franzmannia pantelleriensis TaxID=48727 RepID=A0A1G9UY37_9GAMM|nr:cytochrome b [Halomonas pantelleriensis]SDM64894.1 Cytochrome b561 [Halomonas pantelleriensis]